MMIYTNGCSHTAGHCMKRSKAWPSIVMKSLIGNQSYVMNPDFRKVKSDTNVLFNQALHGAGNDYIFHTTIETISGLLSNGFKPDYVIIQWSGPNRRLHSTIDGGHIFINPHDNTELGILFEPMASRHTLHFMFMLQEFLKVNDIPYLFFNYMSLSKLVKKSSTYSHLDFDRFLDFEINHNVFTDLIQFFKDNDMSCDEGGHPNELGNYFMGEHIVNKLGYDCIDYSEFYNVNYI